ncbi:MAG TPA: cytochrome c [Anaerolineales bacterium]|nr:cytochrome c [Anaerolineales bacterium]
MNRVFKWTGIGLGCLIGLILIVVLGLYAKSSWEFGTKYNVQVETVVIPTDAASLERGRHLATILCMECHGDNLAGKTDWINFGPLGSANTPNLTSGKGGVGGQFTNDDFVRVLRHGVKPDGTSVFIMPANDFYYLSDRDLGDVIAYVRSVPPVAGGEPSSNLHFSFMGDVLYGAGVLGNSLVAAKIDQTDRPGNAPEAGVSAAYGGYLVSINGCRSCHGAQLAGGKTPQPGSPLAPNLTPGGELSAWTSENFRQTLHTGVTPSGMSLPNQFMPWDYKGRMTDDELEAVFLYLQSLPKLPTSTAPAE